MTSSSMFAKRMMPASSAPALRKSLRRGMGDVRRIPWRAAVALAICAGAALTGSCGAEKTSLYVVGDSSAVGSEILVDGRAVGRLDSLDVAERGVPLTFAPSATGSAHAKEWLCRPGELKVDIVIYSVPQGDHEICVVSADDARLCARGYFGEYSTVRVTPRRLRIILESH